MDNGTLSASVVTAFTAPTGGTTIETVDVVVTVTDDLGEQAMATLTIDVFPATGNVLGTGPSPADATKTLEEWLGLNVDDFELSDKQRVAADMNGDDDVTPFDAALNFAAFFAKGEIQAVVSNFLEYGEVTQNGAFVEIPLMVVGGDLGDIVSVSFEAQLDPEAVAVQGIDTDLDEGWLVRHSVDETGLLRIGIAGNGVIGVSVMDVLAFLGSALFAQANLIRYRRITLIIGAIAGVDGLCLLFIRGPPFS